MRFLVLLSLLLILSPATRAEDEKKPEIKYSPPTRSSLSRLYWKLNKMDIKKDADIDNFMLINKCDIYKKSYQDDFAWHEIRNKARASILKNKDRFSARLQMTQPIRLQRYNVIKQTFPLKRAINTSKFEIRALDERSDDWDCSDLQRGNSVWRYPHDAILSFSSPFTLDEIKVDTDTAKKYQDLYKTMTKQKHGRPAYLVQKIKVFDATPFGKDPTLHSTLEAIEIYGDSKKELLLYKENMRFKRRNQAE